MIKKELPMNTLTSKTVTLTLYAVMYMSVALITFLSFKVGREAALSDPIASAVGAALSVVYGIKMTEKHLFPRTENN